jgi:gliding motility-associated-like protein
MPYLVYSFLAYPFVAALRLALGCGFFLWGCLTLCMSVWAQAPANDNCSLSQELVISPNPLGSGTASATVQLGAATVQAGEYFTEVHRSAGQVVQSVWFRFSLGTARKITLSLSSIDLPANSVGLTVYRGPGCPPDSSAWLATGIPSIAALGSVFDGSGCLAPGNYLVQLTGSAQAIGTAQLTLTTQPPNLPYDLPATAYGFGVVSGAQPPVALSVGCYTIDSPTENCNLDNGQTQSAWFVFQTDNFIDVLRLGIRSSTLFTSDSAYYRLYAGDARTTPPSSLTLLRGCTRFRVNDPVATPVSFDCSVVQPNQVYTLQVLFRAGTRFEGKLELVEAGEQPTAAPNPTAIPPAFQLGTLGNGVPMEVQEYLACNARMADNLCPPLAPPFAVQGSDTFLYASYLTFDLNTLGVLELDYLTPGYALQLWKGNPAQSCVLEPVGELGDVGNIPLCDLQPETYTLQILSKTPGVNVRFRLTFYRKIGFGQSNPDDLGIITGPKNGEVDVISCVRDTIVGNIGSISDPAGGGSATPGCQTIVCNFRMDQFCRELYKLCDTTYYDRFIYRQFQLTEPTVIEIKNVTGINPFMLISGKVTDPLNFPLNAESNCTYYYRSNPCTPDPPGFYTVISFASSAERATPSNIQVSRVTVSTATPPSFNRPHKAHAVNNGQPLNWTVTGTPTDPQSQLLVPLPPATFNCQADTPFKTFNYFPCCPWYTFNRTAYYVFTLGKESYVRLFVSNGDTNIFAKLYRLDVRTDSAGLEDSTKIVQDCDRCGKLEYCRLQPGTYTLVLYVNDNLIGKTIQPVLGIDRVAGSAYDFAFNAHDAGALPPGLTAAAPDLLSCRTGAFATDPPLPLGSLCQIGVLPDSGASIQYPMPVNTPQRPEWADPDRSPCTGLNPQRNIWYTFRVLGAGKVRIRLRKSSNLNSFPLMRLYEAPPDAGNLTFDQLRQLGRVDSTLATLQLVAQSDSATCLLRGAFEYVKSLCVPRRYYLLVSQTENSFGTFVVQPEYVFTPDTISAGDFCANAATITPTIGGGTETVALTVNCHTLGEGLGEDGTNLDCLQGPEGMVSSWYRIVVSGNQNVDLTVSMDEATTVLPDRLTYRLLYGSCGALTPVACVSTFTRGLTLVCVPPGSYFIQLMGPTNYQGEVSLRVQAVPTPNPACITGIKPLKADFSWNRACRSNTIRFANTSTAGPAITYEWQFDTTRCCQTSTAFSPEFNLVNPDGKLDTAWVKLIVRNTETGQADSITRPLLLYPSLGQEQIVGPDTLCPGQVVRWVAPPGYISYLWSDGQVTREATFTEAGSYILTLLDPDSCEYALLKELVSPVFIPVELPDSVTLCYGQAVELTAPADTTGRTYRWMIGDSLVARGPRLVLNSVTAPLILSLYQEQGGCVQPVGQTIRVVLEPRLTLAYRATPNPAIYPNQTIAFASDVQPSGRAYTYAWEFGNPVVARSTVPDPVITFSSEGEYPVRLRVEDVLSGCVDSLQGLVVELIRRDTITIPNVFTPNADGTNDLFAAEYLGFEPLEFRVFDRWGVLVYDFQSVSPPKFWDGTYYNGGRLCPAGWYYYQCVFRRRDGLLYRRQGGVTLVR